jgi:hypothetical protein
LLREGNDYSSIKYAYDENNNKIWEEHYDSRNELTQRFLYSDYTIKGKPSHILESTKKNEIEHTIETTIQYGLYTTTKNIKVSALGQIVGDKVEYKVFNKNNYLIYHEIKGFYHSTPIPNDRHGRPSGFNLAEYMKERYFGRNLKLEYTHEKYYYDENGLLANSTYNEDGSLKSQIIYVRNEHGDCIGAKKSDSEYHAPYDRYEYNNAGDWVHFSEYEYNKIHRMDGFLVTDTTKLIPKCMVKREINYLR